MEQLIQFSFVGPLHNATLNDVTKLADFPNYTLEEVYNLSKQRVETYYTDHSLGDPKVIPLADYLAGIKRVDASGDDMSSLFKDMQSKGEINDVELGFLLSMNKAFQNAEDPNVVANDLFNISQAIEKESKLSFSEQTLVWGATNVGISSAPYWYSALINPKSPWNDGGLKAAKRKWWVTALRDLAGFVVGAAVGGLLSGGNPAVMVAGGTVVGTGASA